MYFKNAVKIFLETIENHKTLTIYEALECVKTKI